MKTLFRSGFRLLGVLLPTVFLLVACGKKTTSGTADGGTDGTTSDASGMGDADVTTDGSTTSLLPVGAACTEDSQCSGPNPECLDGLTPLESFLTSTNPQAQSLGHSVVVNLPEGYCSNEAPCQSDVDCGDQGRCFLPLIDVDAQEYSDLVDILGLPQAERDVLVGFREFGQCLLPCVDDTDCTRPGYVCAVPLYEFVGLVEAIGGRMETYCIGEPVDACDPDPCANGTCTGFPDGTFTCECDPGWMGDLCDEVNSCDPDPCVNGTCTVNPDSTYTCTCDAGWLGDECDVDDPCDPDPCVHGTCSVNPDFTRTCACDTGWIGVDCDLDDPCDPDPCLNGGTCTEQGGAALCTGCDPGWSGDLCEIPHDCGHPGTVTTPLNVDVSGGTTLDATVLYSCDVGFVLNGAAVRTCQPTGWSDAEPTCSLAPVTCQADTCSFHGTCVEVGGVFDHCDCDPGWLPPNCATIQDCGAPDPAPTNGSLSVTTTTYGSTASYGCDAGYNLVGSATSTCQADGTWSNPAPTCAPVDCGAPDPAPTNGSLSVTTTTLGSTASYGCDAGYILTGSASATCQANGTWSDPAPTCTPVDCGAPGGPPTNGTLSYTTTTFGSTATYGCDAGYNLVGSASATCQANSTWSTPAPTCAPVDCGAPAAAPPNGSLTYTTTTFGSTASYSCDPGYNLAGSSSATCQANGTWSATAPTCTPVDCGAPGAAPANGTLSYTTTTFGSTASYGCNVGFVLNGSASVTCLTTGAWSDVAPTCDPEPVTCQPDTCSFHGNCVEVGGVFDHCDCDPGWLPPNCSAPVDCGAPAAAPPNGSLTYTTTTFGSTATYGCDPGYNLAGSTTSTCQANGTWSDPAPTCTPVDCGAPPAAPANGSVTYTTTTLGSTATYSCDPGYNLAGSTTSTCQTNGTWSDPAPTCTIVDCGAPPAAPANGSRSYTTTTYGSTATYSCDPGYNLAGATTSTCQANGTWSDPAPTCTIVDCGAPDPAPADGSLSYTTTTFGSIATYDCDPGYNLVGSATSTCQANGTWSDPAPTCAIVDCGPPDPAPADGSVSYTTTTYGSTATYDCDPGYTLAGSPTSTCQASGTWSDPAPTCTIVDCGPPDPAPADGSVTYTTTTFGSTAVYDCDPGFTMNGNDTVTCQSDGFWSDVAPTCDPATLVCDVLYEVDGQFRISEAPQACGDQTRLIGTNTTTPAFDSGWTTPFTGTSIYSTGFIRLRFDESGGAPAAGAVELVEYYMPMEFVVDECFLTSVGTNVDHSLGLLQLNTDSPPILESSPVIDRPCQSWATGQLSGTTLDWSDCDVVPFPTGVDWSHDDAQAQPGDTTTACAMRMTSYGAVTCSGFFCGLVPNVGNQIETWDQLLLNFTFSSTNYSTATFTMPEVQVPESTSESNTRTWLTILQATPIHIECGDVSTMTCDEVAP